MLVVESNVKKIQHPTGGVIRELRVRDGDQVSAGDVLVRLDDTQTGANLGVIITGIDHLTARRARLEAEQDEAPRVDFSPLLTRFNDPGSEKMLAAEQRLFETRRAAREGQKAQLVQRIEQLSEQIQGTEQQIVSKVQEIELVDRELESVRLLWSKNLVPLQRVTALERDAARLRGERGALISGVAQTRTKVTETKLQILQVEQDFRSEVGKELAEIRAKMGELAEKRVAAEDQLKRVEIRAPQDGRVHQLSVHTIGGVVSPGEPLMTVVPHNDALAVEAKIAPHQIDQVRPGQPAVLRFSAFEQGTTPELNGEVTLVSADVTQEVKTGVSYYTVRIAIPRNEIARLRGLKLVPGMPVESFIKTGERTVLTYLTKPLADQIARAWRER
jgi:HlyD family secretion protein